MRGLQRGSAGDKTKAVSWGKMGHRGRFESGKRDGLEVMWLVRGKSRDAYIIGWISSGD